ncbi:MAG: complex 1 protein-domain-containing protein [Monoraphidium minutum]|nr:MAG: complex 1 protein-domain-containing protein [Monoraphidium minutum]
MRSGVAGQVLSLYRSVLRAARAKDAETRASVAAYARAEFDKSRGISKTNVQQIEHLLRKGERQLAQLSDTHFSGFRWPARG